MGCCLSSTGNGNAEAADSNTLDKSTEAAQESMIVVEMKEDTRDIECTHGGSLIVTAESAQVIETNAAVSSEVNNNTAATTGSSQEIDVARTAAAEQKTNVQMNKKSATISGSSIGVGPAVYKPKRAHTITESISKKQDQRYWGVDLKG